MNNISEALDLYQTEACKTMNTNLTQKEINSKMAMKLVAEIGALCDKIVGADHFFGTLQDAFMEEKLGDILWFIAIIADNNGIRLSDIANYNIDKLRKRHGHQFNENYYLEKELK